jgi:hypothetical protein
MSDIRNRSQSSEDSSDAAGADDVTLANDLIERVERRLPRTDFDSVDDYVAFVLEETLARVEADADDQPEEVDEQAVEQRLESLGYLE